MALNLLNSYGKRGVSFGLLTKRADVTDNDYLSKYFIVSEFSPTFTAGRNSVSLNGSSFLKVSSEILIECLDSSGNNLFIEMAVTNNSSAVTYPYKEATAFVFAIHVYNDTTDGVGKLILYGTLIDGRTVKWSRNITIDKTQQNHSKVRFYNRPLLEIESVEVPVLSTDTSNLLKSSVTFGGIAYGEAVNPSRDTVFPTVNRRNIDVDYRITVKFPLITSATAPFLSINSQMKGATAVITPLVIQPPLSMTDVAITSGPIPYIISDVITNNTFKIIDPYLHSDGKGHQVVTNISSASFSITYPFISYNNSTASYLQSNINGNLITIRQSYADVTYRNIRTFTGYLARHKIYRKSLLSNADFSIVADEPLFINELLQDSLTQNKFYDKLGKFYNQDHINRYWFTSSNNLHLTASPDIYIDSMRMTSPQYNNLSGSDYLIVKNDSAFPRNAFYVPFDNNEFLLTSGSSYDSNFMELKTGVQYIIQISAVIEKDAPENDSRLELYFTSSLLDATKDVNFTATHGIKMATLLSDKIGTTKRFYDNVLFFYTPSSDLFGTMVIVPYRCQAHLRYISFRVYGDDGFSPDVFTTRIPWPISVANETFQIKSELFDINHNLVYSNLNTVQNFDPSGSSLIPFIPSGGGGIQPGSGNLIVSGSLYVSKSVIVDGGPVTILHGGLFVPNLGTQPRDVLISQSRFLTVREDPSFPGQISVTPVVDVGHDSNYLYVITASLGTANIFPGNPVSMKTSLASQYNGGAGGHIYYVSGVKFEERPTGY
jgi:hypothetical protein